MVAWMPLITCSGGKRCPRRQSPVRAPFSNRQRRAPGCSRAEHLQRHFAVALIDGTMPMKLTPFCLAALLALAAAAETCAAGADGAAQATILIEGKIWTADANR